MDTDIIDWVLAIYLAGLIINVFSSLKSYWGFKSLKENQGIDILRARPDMQSYLIKRVVMWPLYFIIEKNPVERISEIFFKHYGDEGHIYYLSNGIKNFANDLFKGKKRYKNYQAGKMLWILNKNSVEYNNWVRLCGRVAETPYAEITYARNQDIYLLKIVTTSQNVISNNISRFEIDNCQKMTFLEFQKKLISVNGNFQYSCRVKQNRFALLDT